MSNDKAIERLWKLQAKMNMLVLDGKRDATRVADLLQSVLDEPQLPKGGELSIDCDAQPFIPTGWSIREEDQIKSVVKGKLSPDEFNKITLYMSTKQNRSGCINGHELFKELERQPVLTANVLDFYLANQHLIPAHWKLKAIFFWGTIYRDSKDNLTVRYLMWSGESWIWQDGWLVSDWNNCSPAAVVSVN